MTNTVSIHPKALEEFKNASIWYEERQVGLGLRFEQIVEIKINQILNRPETYAKIKGPFRQVKIKTFPYVIVYSFSAMKHEVYISSIFHTKRNPRGKYRRP